MLQLDGIKLHGSLHILLFDENGDIKDERYVPNLVTTLGKAWLTNRMIGVADGVIAYMGFGTGAVAPAAGDTDLGTVLSARIATTVSGGSRVNETTTNDAVEWIATAPATAPYTGAITEAGLFVALTVGTMLSRTTFSAVNKTATDTLQITWRVKAA